MGSGASRKAGPGAAKGNPKGGGPGGRNGGPGQGNYGDNYNDANSTGGTSRRGSGRALPPYEPRDDTHEDTNRRSGGRPPSAPYRPRNDEGGPGKAGPGKQGGLARHKSFDERARLMDELEHISNQAIEHPTGPVYNSPSYDSSFEYYNSRVNSNSQEELESWLDLELETLKHRVVDNLLQAQYTIHDMKAIQDSAQLYEYRLQLAALTHVFQRENHEWERYNMQLDNERQQDMEFLRSLQERVERGTQRPVVLDTMSDYAHRNNGKGRSSGNVYPAAGRGGARHY